MSHFWEKRRTDRQTNGDITKLNICELYFELKFYFYLIGEKNQD